MFPDAEGLAGTVRGPRAAILLAAGASTRLGRPKQLVQVDGKSLLRRAAEAAIASGASPVMVVLGREAETLARELAGLAVAVVENPAWREGMGSSLRCGMEALHRETPTAEAVLLMVCDQPLVTADRLARLWARYVVWGKVVAVRHGDRPGVPAIFPARFFADLANISGDRGARGLLGSLTARELDLVEMPEAEIDLDTPQDLARLAGSDPDSR